MLLVAVRQDPLIPHILALMEQKRVPLRYIAQQIGSNHQSVNEWLTCQSMPRKEGVFREIYEVVQNYRRPGHERVDRVGLRRVPVVAPLVGGVPQVITGKDGIEVRDWGTDVERWAREIHDSSLDPLLKAGDHAVMENRPALSGHVVQAQKNGSDALAIFKGHGSSARLCWLDGREDSLIQGWEIQGVVVQRIRTGPRNRREETEYPLGMMDLDREA